MNSIEILDKKTQLVKRNNDIISLAKTEVRELSVEENEEFERNTDEIKNLDVQLEELNRELENTKKISIDKKMNKNDFIIRSLAEAYKAGQKDNIKIDRSFTVTGVSGEGEDVVSVDLANEVILPLKEDRLFAKLATIRTGLVGNPQIPVYVKGGLAGGSNGHVAETGTAPEFSSSFTNITMSPKRVSAFATISKQFLIQATPAAQQAVLNDLSEQIWDKIEANLLSDSAATETKPAGILYNLEQSEVETYRDLCNLEADLREKNYKNVEFVLSPRAEAHMKSELKTAHNQVVFQDGKLDGIDTTVSSLLDPKDFMLGDFSALLIGFWQDPTFQIYEDFQLAKDGLVGIVVNAFYDAKLSRADAIAYAKVVESEPVEDGQD